MAPQVAEAMATLEQQGRVERRRGRLQSAALFDGGLQVTTCHAGETRVQTADIVIQATGLNTNVLDTDHRLIKQLLTNAHVLPDPLGLGLRSSTEGHLQRSGEQWPHLFAIGGLLQGTFWESIAIPEIRQQARNISRQLLID